MFSICFQHTQLTSHRKCVPTPMFRTLGRAINIRTLQYGFHLVWLASGGWAVVVGSTNMIKVYKTTMAVPISCVAVCCVPFRRYRDTKHAKRVTACFRNHAPLTNSSERNKTNSPSGNCVCILRCTETHYTRSGVVQFRGHAPSFASQHHAISLHKSC